MSPTEHAVKGSAEGKLEVDNFWQSFTYEEKKTKEHPGLKVKGYWGYDQGAKRFVRAAVGNHGEWDTASAPGWEGDKLVWTGELSGPMGRIPFHHTFTKKSDKEWTHLLELRLPDGKWVPAEEHHLQKVVVDLRRFRFVRPAVWAIMPRLMPGLASTRLIPVVAERAAALRRDGAGAGQAGRPQGRREGALHARHVVLRPRPLRRRDQGVRGRLPAEERSGVPLQPGAVVPAGRQPRAGGALLQDLPALRPEGAEPRRHRREDQGARSSWSRKAARRRPRRRPPTDHAAGDDDAAAREHHAAAGQRADRERRRARRRRRPTTRRRPVTCRRRPATRRRRPPRPPSDPGPQVPHRRASRPRGVGRA